jgi:hypothetical protein
MKRQRDEIGYMGRLAIMIIGLGLMRQLDGPRFLIGVLGLILFLAAVGAIELGMALWYRTKRHRLATSQSTARR